MPGCPIRKSRDQWLFAPSPSLSQLITSFIASQSLGIHRSLFVYFFFFIVSHVVIHTYFLVLFLFSTSLLLFFFQYVKDLLLINLLFFQGCFLFCGHNIFLIAQRRKGEKFISQWYFILIYGWTEKITSRLILSWLIYPVTDISPFFPFFFFSFIASCGALPFMKLRVRNY